MLTFLQDIRRFIQNNVIRSKANFSDFIRKSSTSEKEHVFGEVMKQSNKDQREILDAYSKKFPL